MSVRNRVFRRGEVALREKRAVTSHDDIGASLVAAVVATPTSPARSQRSPPALCNRRRVAQHLTHVRAEKLTTSWLLACSTEEK